MSWSSSCPPPQVNESGGGVKTIFVLIGGDSSEIVPATFKTVAGPPLAIGLYVAKIIKSVRKDGVGRGLLRAMLGQAHSSSGPSGPAYKYS